MFMMVLFRQSMNVRQICYLSKPLFFFNFIVTRRCFNVLGFDKYHESLVDGLQVLRYNKTKAYIPHFDWIEDLHERKEHDFDSERIGSNRFVTVLLYFNDLTDGEGG